MNVEIARRGKAVSMRYEGGAFGAAARACQPRLKNHHAAAVGANDNGVMRMRCFEVFDPEDMTASFSYKREAARLRRGGPRPVPRKQSKSLLL